jgi:outer membrane beta-barrel protein
MNFDCTMLKRALLAGLLLAPGVVRAAPQAATEGAGTTGESSTDEDKSAKKNGPRTLEDRIRPVSGGLFVRKGRTELTPNVNVSVNDAFFQKYMFGLKLAYHLSDSFAIGLHGAFGISTPSGAINKCTADGCSTPTKDDLVTTPGNITLLAGLGAEWSPLYGKLNFFGEKVLHFDTFFQGGLDGVQYANPAAQDNASAFTFGGHVGVGQHFVINEFSAIRVELRDYIYQGQRTNNSGAESHLENQLMLEIGLSFFFPLHASEG